MDNPYEFVEDAWVMGQIDGSHIQEYVLRDLQLSVSEMVTTGTRNR